MNTKFHLAVKLPWSSESMVFQTEALLDLYMCFIIMQVGCMHSMRYISIPIGSQESVIMTSNSPACLSIYLFASSMCIVSFGDEYPEDRVGRNCLLTSITRCMERKGLKNIIVFVHFHIYCIHELSQLRNHFNSQSSLTNVTVLVSAGTLTHHNVSYNLFNWTILTVCQYCMQSQAMQACIYSNQSGWIS